MNRTICVLGVLVFGLSVIWSCREDLDFVATPTALTFSTDTLNLDTVYTQYNSETYVVKVYNRGGEDALIPRIALNRGADSFFRLNVDGEPGFEFENIPLRSNDSLFVFVEMAVGDVAQDTRYEDLLQVGGMEFTPIVLEAFVERVVYYLPNAGGNSSVLEETLWDDSVGRFIVGDLTIPSSLTIEAGTRVYFAQDASIQVSSGANLEVTGSQADPVIFRGQRNDARYDSLPDQWNGIRLASNANLDLNYARVMGGQTAIHLDPMASASLQNSVIVNNQNYGIFAHNATVSGHNLVLNNANLATIALVGGGSYDFSHCSVANFFDLDAGANLSLLLSNEWEGSIANLNATFGNDIFYGRAQNAIRLNSTSGANFSYSFESCAVRNANTAALDVQADSNFTGNTITENPLFVNTEFSQNNLRLGMDSPCIGVGNTAVALVFPVDFDGVSRIINPSIGAFQ